MRKRFDPERSIDFTALRSTIIQGRHAAPSYSRKADFSKHLEMLEQEFSGQSALLFVHAALNAHIRREIDLAANIARFWQMWNQEADFLLKNSNARWLISSCDTIMCHASCDLERAAAIAGSLFMNTIKLYETERLATGAVESDYAKVGGRNQLFDGLTAFNIGAGDMIAALVTRVRKPFPAGTIAPRILQELLTRALTQPTVFSRFAKVHMVDSTRW